MPTMEYLVREDTIEMQVIWELGMSWAWFVNDLRMFFVLNGQPLHISDITKKVFQV